MVWGPSSQDLKPRFSGEKDSLAGVSEETGNNRTLGNGKIPANIPKGVVEDPSQRLKRSTAQLKGLFLNAHSMGNKRS